MAVPVVELNVALTLAVPRPALVARPVALFTSAIAGLEDVHCETVVMSCDEPSLKLPVAMNCCAEPRAIEAEGGATERLEIVALETVSVVV